MNITQTVTENNKVVIFTHPRPHLDEITGIYLLWNYGEEMYPGVQEAITSKRIHAQRPEDCAEIIARYKADGYTIIMLGMGGGEFDEHSTATTNRKDRECCASLVAKKLGVVELPELEKILKFVSNTDLKGSSQPFDLKTLVDRINDANLENWFVAIDFAMTALHAKHTEQILFHQPGREAAEKAVRTTFQTSRKATIRVATIVTDSEHAAQYIRSKKGGGADVIIQQHPETGNTQIFSDRRAQLNFDDLAKVLRVAEQEAGGKISALLPNELAREGSLAEVPEWYFMSTGGMLLNGSKTSPNVPATNLPLHVINSLVQIGLGGKFAASKASTCVTGVCDAKKNGCPWYKFHLSQCASTRAKMEQYQQGQSANMVAESKAA